MIEKLDTKMEVVEISILGNEKAECLDFTAGKRLNSKINELVDTVNVLQSQVAILEEHAHPTAKTPADPYAKQRKWIGCLCRFWNKTEYTDDLYGVLTDIVPTNKYKPEDNYFVPFKDEFGSFYEHCEPVKPDDDIIYKGE